MRTCLIIALLMAPLHAGPEWQPVRAGNKIGDEWTNTQGIVFRWCPPGKMSGPPGQSSVTPGFWLGKFEVTRHQFDLVTRKNPRGALATRADHPRDAIRHDDILQFVDEMNRRERFFKRLPDGWIYALPTEWEWEYACRAGTKTTYSFGDDAAGLASHGNFADRSLRNTGDDRYRHAHPDHDDGVTHLATVGTFRPNPWGFHDMHGNLWEWTASLDPHGHPVARGGSWVSRPSYCTSGFRRTFPVITERPFIGFRLALKRSAPASDQNNDPRKGAPSPERP